MRPWTILAEGEELGSNLLHVAQSSPGDPGGSGSLKIGMAAGSPRPDPETAVPVGPRLARRSAGQPNRASHPRPAEAPIDRISEPGAGLGTGIRPSDNSRQLKDLSPEVLHLRGQKQILPIRHRQDAI